MMGINEFKIHLTSCKRSTKIEDYFGLLSFCIFPLSSGFLLISSFKLTIESAFFSLFMGGVFYFSLRYCLCYYNYLKADPQIEKLRTDLSIDECHLILQEIFTTGNNILISKKNNFLSFRIGKEGRGSKSILDIIVLENVIYYNYREVLYFSGCKNFIDSKEKIKFLILRKLPPYKK